jgi:DNA invertase Pin-like site-specific DNA recombinase
MKRAAIYARVSSDRQAKEGDSIPAQLEALRKYAKKNKYKIIGEYIDDGISGTKKDRDELQKLLDAVEADKVDIIIFVKLDRWFRSVRHYINTQALLDAHKVDWLAIWEPVYDTTTPAGRLIVNQMMSIAQFEAENTGQRIRQVQAYKVTKREVISGTVSPGYKIQGKHLVIDPDKADAARLAFDTFNKTGSYSETIRATYGMGLPVTGNGMKNLLRREIYIGRAHGLDDFAPAIIDADTFQSVQKQINMQRRQSKCKHTYLFSGLLKCAECGAVMASLARKRSGRNTHLMYRCPKHYQRTVKTCSNAKIVYESVLERYLVAQFPSLVINQIEILEAKQRPIRSAQAERERIERKIDRLKDLYVNDLIDLEEYKADKERLLTDLASIPTEQRADETALEALRSLVGLNLEEIYTGMSRAEKRLFWRSVVKEIRFDSERHFFVDFV